MSRHHIAAPSLCVRVTASAPQRKAKIRRTIFSYTQTGLVSQASSQQFGDIDIMSPFPPSGKEGYIHNQDVLLILSVRLLNSFGIHREQHLQYAYLTPGQELDLFPGSLFVPSPLLS